MTVNHLPLVSPIHSSRRHKFWHFLSAFVLSAAAFYLATEYWYFSWIALVLLCLYAIHASTAATFTAGFFSCFLGAANPKAVLPLIVYWPLILQQSVMFAFVLVIFGHIARKWKGRDTGFIFACGLTAQEFVMSLYSPHGTVHSLAYTQLDNLPVIQIASITGIWGITFSMALICATFSLFCYFPEQRRLTGKTNILPIGLFMLIVLFGVYRLYTPIENEKIKVGIAAISTSLQQYIAAAEKRDKEQVRNVMERYRQKVELLAGEGVQVVLLPEKLVSVEEQDEYFQQLNAMAKQNRVQLIAGVTRKEGLKLYNSACIFPMSGANVFIYDKQHLLGTFESRYTSGGKLGIANNWGLAICKDMDFTYPVLEYSKQGSGIVFVPALDFHDDGWSHARVAVMRGIEGNYAVARAGQWGYLTLSDSRGRIIEKSAVDEHEDGVVLAGEISLGSGKSIYSQIGDSFAWLSVVSFIVLSLWLASNTLALKHNDCLHKN